MSSPRFDISPGRSRVHESSGWHEQMEGEGWGMCGALGNGLDRLRDGYVVDFIDVSYNDFHWPAFNFADSFITVGAIIFFFYIFKNN